MSILTKAKNMTAKKTEERAQDGSISDRHYDLYKVVSGIQMTLSLIVLSAILGFVMTMSDTLTTERIATSQQGIEIKHLKTNVVNNSTGVSNNSARITQVEVSLGEQRAKQDAYLNPFRSTTTP